IDRHAPDLYVALAAYLALRARTISVVKWGILLGCLKDCASLDPLGTHAFVLGATTFLFARPRDEDTPVATGLAMVLSVFGPALDPGAARRRLVPRAARRLPRRAVDGALLVASPLAPRPDEGGRGPGRPEARAWRVGSSSSTCWRRPRSRSCGCARSGCRSRR